MLIDSFIKEIQNEISLDCQLPLELPKKSILRIMKRAYQFFHRNYEYAVEESIHIIPSTELQSKEFKQSRSLRLPKCIQSVVGVKQGGNLDLFIDNPDYSLTRWIYESSGMSYVNGDALTYKVMEQFYLDFTKTLVLNSVSWDYNYNTKNFKIIGEIPPRHGLLLHTLDLIPDDKLADDPLFFDYVVGKCMENLGRILSIYKLPLPGGVDPDFQSIKEDGKEMVREVVEKIKGEEGVDYFYVQDSM